MGGGKKGVGREGKGDGGKRLRRENGSCGGSKGIELRWKRLKVRKEGGRRRKENW